MIEVGDTIHIVDEELGLELTALITRVDPPSGHRCPMIKGARYCRATGHGRLLDMTLRKQAGETEEEAASR